MFNLRHKVNKLSISKFEVFVFRAPIETPVKTSFGTMYDRPSVLVRVEDADGCFGWGEVWCNFPICGAEHRARLITDVLAPLIVQQAEIKPAQYFEYLTNKTHILEIQCGEPGPLSQTIAGVDIALWDLAARKANVPLFRFFNDRESTNVPAYASGIHPDAAIATVKACRESGYRAFKLKVGFGHDKDFEIVNQIYSQLGPNEELMLDANQGWAIKEAEAFIDRIKHMSLGWIEEPIAADRPDDEWAHIANKTALPIAGGENIRGARDFSKTIADGHIRVIQPDACKWGGITGCVAVAQEAIANHRRYCPHYLGGGIGLVASAHILAGVGGDGLLEVDVNPNPLRECLAEPYPNLKGGNFILPDKPGLGVEPNMEIAKKYLVSSYRYQ